MGYGESPIHEKKDPKTGKSYSPRRWEFVICHGTKPNGKPNKVKRVVRGTRQEAIKARDDLRRALEYGISVDAERVTFAEYANAWHARRAQSGEYQARTIEHEGHNVERLCAALGNVRLKDVSALQIEAAFTETKQEYKGRGKAGTLSGTTMRSYYQTLNQIMKHAVTHDMIMRNPCDKVKPPKRDTPEKETLDVAGVARYAAALSADMAEERRAFLEKERKQAQRHNRERRCCVRGLVNMSRLVATRLMLATGMRMGEALGLRRCDVAEGCAAICIRQATDRDGTPKPPKTKAGFRTVALDAETGKALADWLALQRAALLSLGLRDLDGVPVCCSDAATYVTHANFEHWHKQWRDSHGLGKYTPHALRHTQATLLLANRTDIKTVQTRLGHSDAATTLRVYAHAMPGNDEKAAALMGAIMAQEAPRPAPVVAAKTA